MAFRRHTAARPVTGTSETGRDPGTLQVFP